MSEVLDRYKRIADGFEARVAAIAPTGWDAPTPCTDWTVRQLVGHVVATNRAVRATLDKTAPEEVDPEGDLLALWRGARAAVAEGLADEDRASTVVGGTFGEQPWSSLVSRLLCADTLMHTWDLARATGQDERLDPEAVSKAREFLEPLDDAIRRPGGFAPRIDAPAGADEQTALLLFCGRRA